jgi:hypothetical protein
MTPWPLAAWLNKGFGIMWDLGWISFNSSLYLLGALTALIPLLIHLSRSRRMKKMRFSTTRFFTEQFLRSYRMSRLREILLLLCRMALFALLAMALAQPLLKAGKTTTGARSVVLVMDNSASMAYTENEVNLLDRARNSARSVLDNLKDGDEVSVVLAGRLAGGPEVPLEPTTQRNDAYQALNQIAIVRQERDKAPQVRALAGDLKSALARAEELAKAGKHPNREIYVFSDLQESSWEPADKGTTPSEVANISYVFVQSKPVEPVRSVAVTAVQYGSSRPLVGEPFAFKPNIVVQGDIGTAVPRVSLWVYEKDREGRWILDEKTHQRRARKVAEQDLQRLSNGRWKNPHLFHAFAEPGWQAGYIEVERAAATNPDKKDPQAESAAPAQVDSRRYFAVEVLKTIKVLAVNGAPSQVRTQDELFFLRLALNPQLDEEKSSIDVEEVAPDNLAEKLADPDKARSQFPLVILANVESLPAAALDRLEEYTALGGSVFFYLGDKVNADSYNESLAGASHRYGGLLPGKLGKLEGSAQAKEDLTISSLAYDHPALSAFGDPRFARLGTVRFRAFWRIAADPATVLIKLADDAPLLCEKSFGKGRSMLFTSTCNRNWTSFPVQPAFLPFTHRLVAYLAQQPGGATAFYTTGEVVPLVYPGGGVTPLQIRRPTGEVDSPTGNDPTAGVPTYDRTDVAGVYSVITPEQKEVGLLAVNLDSYESDLKYLDEVWTDSTANGDAGPRTAAIEKQLRESQLIRPMVAFVADPTKVSESAGVARKGWPLWDGLLWIVLLIGLFEPWLANQISARLFARKTPVLALPGATGQPPRPAPGRPAMTAAQEVHA